MSNPGQAIFAIRYAERDGWRIVRCVGGDPHDAPMPVAQFVWPVHAAERCFVVDTAFSAATAAARGRKLLRYASAGLE